MGRHATEKAILTLSVRIKTVENEIEAAAADEARHTAVEGDPGII